MSMLFMEYTLSESTPWSSEGIGGKGRSGGQVLGGVTPSRWRAGDMGLIG